MVGAPREHRSAELNNKVRKKEKKTLIDIMLYAVRELNRFSFI